MSWKDDFSNKFESTKIGCDITLSNITINKNEDPKYQPTKKDGTTQGYCYEFIGDDDRTLSATSFSLQKALYEAGVDEGNTINVKHPDTGKYVVTVLEKGVAPIEQIKSDTDVPF
jgi:hypothetical protein